MRSLFLLIATAALTAEAPPNAEIQSFDQALKADHLADATVLVDRLIAERTPSDGKPKSDPLLNSLIGRLYAASGNFPGAALFLDRTPIVGLPQTQRAEAALAHGHALEALGERLSALRAYREAAMTASNEEQHHAAALGAARTLLPQDAAAAGAEVLALDNGPRTSDRWQEEYLLALSRSLQGDGRAAAKLADEAWSDAIHAPLADLAPLHVAILRAGLAAARHDIEAERAMLMAAGGLEVAATPALNSQLPVCGADGVQPSDYVIFGYVFGPYGNRQLVPIAASRREVVSTFHDALVLAPPARGPSGSFGTVFTVACRRVISAGVLTRPRPADPFVRWSVDHAIYPASAAFEDDDKHLNTVAERVDSLAARFGDDSPLLIWPRYQLMQLLEARAKSGDPVVPGQLTDLANKIATGLRGSGAPDWLAGMVDMQARLIEMVAVGGRGSEQVTRSRELMKDELVKMPPELVRETVVENTSKLTGDWPAAAAQMALDLSPRITAALSGVDRRTWLVTVADAERALGNADKSSATLASAGFPADSCARMDRSPTLLRQQFSYEDYPEELVKGEQQGGVLFEFNLTARGTVSGSRIVYSLPAGLFDQASEKGLAKVGYSAPSRDGKDSACDAVYQPVIWRLQNGQEPGLPVFTPGGETTT